LAWDHLSVRACALHRVQLLTRCRCGKPLGYRRLLECSSCGCDLRDLEAPQADSACGGQQEAGRVIAGTSELHPELLGLGIDRLLTAMHRIGSCILGQGLEARIAGRGDHRFAYVDLGHEHLVDWPAGFFRFLDTMRAKAPFRSGRWSIRKEFGAALGLLARGRALAQDPICARFA